MRPKVCIIFKFLILIHLFPFHCILLDKDHIVFYFLFIFNILKQHPQFDVPQKGDFPVFIVATAGARSFVHH